MARILLVDDDRDQLEIRQLILEREGHDVRTAENAGAAVAAFREFRPRAVVMDLRLPDAAAGRGLIRDLRALAPDVYICVLSGWTADLERQPEAALVERILPKPVRTARLLDLLRRMTALLLLAAAPSAMPAADIDDHAPILHTRPDAPRDSDLPLLLYCERKRDGGRTVLEYTSIFSNEDGGHSTRALMARWGRATDIEFVYRVTLDADGRPAQAMIQAKDHKEVEFLGAREGFRPLLQVSTKNNMVAPGAQGPRFALKPVEVHLSGVSREQVMDDHPWLYREMSRELEREGKLRPFGTVDGENISDPRNYLYLEANVTNRDSRIAAAVKLATEPHWRSAHLGRPDYAIERSGWIRTAIELPPGTQPADVSAIGFECLVEGKAISGVCRVEAIRKAFFLDREYKPGADFLSRTSPLVIPSGQTAVVPLHGH